MVAAVDSLNVAMMHDAVATAHKFLAPFALAHGTSIEDETDRHDVTVEGYCAIQLGFALAGKVKIPYMDAKLDLEGTLYKADVVNAKYGWKLHEGTFHMTHSSSFLTDMKTFSGTAKVKLTDDLSAHIKFDNTFKADMGEYGGYHGEEQYWEIGAKVKALDLLDPDVKKWMEGDGAPVKVANSIDGGGCLRLYTQGSKKGWIYAVTDLSYGVMFGVGVEAKYQVSVQLVQAPDWLVEKLNIKTGD